jgi:hypothetical protein
MRRVARPTSATTSARSPATCCSAFCSAERRFFGLLVGLPIDIRHVAFLVGLHRHRFVGLDFSPDLWLFAWAVLGVATIGFMNLTVSFALALNVALRSRQVSDRSGKTWRDRSSAHLRRPQPRDFFLPPKSAGEGSRAGNGRSGFPAAGSHRVRDHARHGNAGPAKR